MFYVSICKQAYGSKYVKLMLWTVKTSQNELSRSKNTVSFGPTLEGAHPTQFDSPHMKHCVIMISFAKLKKRNFASWANSHKELKTIDPALAYNSRLRGISTLLSSDSETTQSVESVAF